MPLRFGINGLGRIGRALLRISCGREEIEAVAVNDLVAGPVLARLLARDTVHGPFPHPVAATTEGGPALLVGDPGRRRSGASSRSILLSHEGEPSAIPWARAGVEVVIEATGRFTSRSSAAAHLDHPARPLRSGVSLVVLSANADPADPADFTLCQGINDAGLDPARQQVVSNASCTTNCLALVARVLHRSFGVRHALANVVHSYTESQRLLDLAHTDPRRARAAALNIIPTATTAPRATGLVLPELAGRIHGFATRVPTPAVAMLDLVAALERPAGAEEVRQVFREAAAGELAGLLGAAEEELVSSDYIGDPRSATVDLPLVQAVGDQVRVVAWYDNEWGYATRLADLLSRLAREPTQDGGQGNGG